MSIELSNVKEDKKSSSFAIDVAMPDLRTKSTAIKIDTKNSMETKKKEEIKKKEPEPKFFYELLEEAVKKGIRPIFHTNDLSRESIGKYYCPVSVVCALLDEMPENVSDSTCGCTISHTKFINVLRSKKVKFMDYQMKYCPVCERGNEGDDEAGAPCGHSDQRSFTEPMLAVHISLWHRFGNLKTARILKALTEGKKPRMKEIPEKVTEERPMFTFNGPELRVDNQWFVRGIESVNPTIKMPGLDFNRHVEYISKDLKLEPDHDHDE